MPITPGPFLVVVPVSVLNQWAEEIDLHRCLSVYGALHSVTKFLAARCAARRQVFRNASLLHQEKEGLVDAMNRQHRKACENPSDLEFLHRG